MKRFVSTFKLLCLLALVTACGFQLRGQYNFNFDRIALSGLEKTEMRRNMDLQLEMLNLAVNPADGAPLKLTLQKEARDRSIVTFNAAGRALEVRLTYTLTYEVKDKNGEYLIASSNLTQRRELSYSDNQALGKEAEENQLYTEMQRDIARQISVRLAALKVEDRKI